MLCCLRTLSHLVHIFPFRRLTFRRRWCRRGRARHRRLHGSRRFVTGVGRRCLHRLGRCGWNQTLRPRDIEQSTCRRHLCIHLSRSFDPDFCVNPAGRHNASVQFFQNQQFIHAVLCQLFIRYLPDRGNRFLHRFDHFFLSVITCGFCSFCGQSNQLHHPFCRGRRYRRSHSHRRTGAASIGSLCMNHQSHSIVRQQHIHVLVVTHNLFRRPFYIHRYGSCILHGRIGNSHCQNTVITLFCHDRRRPVYRQRSQLCRLIRPEVGPGQKAIRRGYRLNERRVSQNCDPRLL